MNVLSFFQGVTRSSASASLTAAIRSISMWRYRIISSESFSLTFDPQCLTTSSVMLCLSRSRHRWVKQESEFARQEATQDSAPKLDLGFKEGQTIKINIGVRSC